MLITEAEFAVVGINTIITIYCKDGCDCLTQILGLLGCRIAANLNVISAHGNITITKKIIQTQVITSPSNSSLPPLYSVI